MVCKKYLRNCLIQKRKHFANNYSSITWTMVMTLSKNSIIDLQRDAKLSLNLFQQFKNYNKWCTKSTDINILCYTHAPIYFSQFHVITFLIRGTYILLNYDMKYWNILQFIIDCSYKNDIFLRKNIFPKAIKK